MTPRDLIDDLRSRINPAYASQVGTESWERRLCVEALEAQAGEIEQLRAEAEAVRRQEPVTHASAVEAVTRAILFEDCSNTEGWEYNTYLGEAAIKAYRPYVQMWRNSAFEAAAGIAEAYSCEDAARDIRAMIAPGAQENNDASK